MNVANPNGAETSAHSPSRVGCFNPSYQMKILLINTHLTYPGWSEGKLNLAFMDLAKAFFVERASGSPRLLSSGAMTPRKR